MITHSRDYVPSTRTHAHARTHARTHTHNLTSGDGGDGSPSSVELTVIVLVAAAVCALVGGILLYLCCSICRIQWDYHKAIKVRIAARVIHL